MPENPYIPPGDLWAMENPPPGDQWEREKSLRAPADKTNQRQPEPEPKATKKGLFRKIVDRLSLLGTDEFGKKMDETYLRTHGDVFRERFGENHPAYQRLTEMGDSLDKAHNLPFYFPTNRWHKEKLREAFDEMGIERKY